MSHKSLQQLLKEGFSKADKHDWVKVASKEVDGGDPLKSLRWVNQDGIEFLPYYEKSDQLSHLSAFEITSSTIPYLGARAWFNLPVVSLETNADANGRALNLLNQGADGIYFSSSRREEIIFENLLEKIDWPYCHLSFQINQRNSEKLSEYIQKQNYAPHAINGALYWDQVDKEISHLIHRFENQKNFRLLGLIIQPSTPVQEITEALHKGVQVIDTLSNQNLTVEKIITNISLSIHADTDFLSTIAKLKALRMLWFQIAQAYGVQQFLHEHLHLHSYSSPWTNEKFQPHANMLKSTTAALSSIIGGCNSLSAIAEDDSNNMMNRIACNVSNILREESYVDKVSDPLAGAYALDNMINDFAEQAWKAFQLSIK
jgi:methylmalonyl-CoA mutase